MIAEKPKAPANPIGPAPVRHLNSVRRTSTIDTSWPDGFQGQRHTRSVARDIFRDRHGDSFILADDWVEIVAGNDREIMAIQTSRHNDIAQQLVGLKGGGHLRRALADLLPDEVEQATPLNLLIDDFSGASLVAPWAWTQWSPDWPSKSISVEGEVIMRRMEGICTGFAPGSSALDRSLPLGQQNAVRVPTMVNSDDPEGWHPLATQSEVGMRRARRMDVMIDGVIQIDIGFQDSSSAPDGGERMCVHEYRVTATADPVTLRLLSIDADPRILPFPECPGGTRNLPELIGLQLADLRVKIPEILPGTRGCTHLNDVLRSMTDIPALVRKLVARTA